MHRDQMNDLRRIEGRLSYAYLQLAREAKFKSRWKNEDQRFFRGLDALGEISEEFSEILWKLNYDIVQEEIAGEDDERD